MNLDHIASYQDCLLIHQDGSERVGRLDYQRATWRLATYTGSNKYGTSWPLRDVVNAIPISAGDLAFREQMAYDLAACKDCAAVMIRRPIAPGTPVKSPDGIGEVESLRDGCGSDRQWWVKRVDGLRRWYAEKNLIALYEPAKKEA